VSVVAHDCYGDVMGGEDDWKDVVGRCKRAFGINEEEDGTRRPFLRQIGNSWGGGGGKKKDIRNGHRRRHGTRYGIAILYLAMVGNGTRVMWLMHYEYAPWD